MAICSLVSLKQLRIQNLDVRASLKWRAKKKKIIIIKQILYYIISVIAIHPIVISVGFLMCVSVY